MSSEPIIEVSRLLAPISDEAPTGEALSLADFEGPLKRVKDSWDEARKLVKEQEEKERFGGEDANGQPWRIVPNPDWGAVLDLAQDTLANKSKDFRIAAWMTEALLRMHALPGLCQGLEVCKGLCDQYWDGLHPAANEEDGHGVTVSAFAALVSDATFSALLDTPVVFGQKPNEREPRGYSANQFLNAKELETVDTEERERRLKDGQVEMGDIRSILDVTPAEFHASNIQWIDQATETLTALGDFLRENCKDDEYDEPTAPGVSQFREQLDGLRRLVKELAGDEMPADAPGGEDGDSDNMSAASATSAKQQMTRDSAFKTIESIAQFFEKTEPHTPVHFALRQVVRWGRMPLHELLTELIDDSTVMGALRRQIGLPPADEE